MNNNINPLNNTDLFNEKKNNMNRSNTIMTFLLILVIFLLCVIGYLIICNVRANNDTVVEVIEKCDEVKNVDCEVKNVSYSVETKTLKELENLMPKIKGTNYLDYNLYNTSGLKKEEIDKLNTLYDEFTYKQVIYYIYKTELTENKIYLYVAVALYDDNTKCFYRSASDVVNCINNKGFDAFNDESLTKFGGNFKLTYYNSTVGYYLESISVVE